MYIDEMIASEVSEDMYGRWKNYRKELTNWMSTIIEHHIEEKVSVNGNEAPTIAIWGAGMCNDIDIAKLSMLGRLVLIDNEKSRCKEAIERHCSDGDAVAVDLCFYDIEHERLRQFEEMLHQGVAIEELHEFLSELLLEAVSCDPHSAPEFDISIVVGLTSQLNSRLAALVYRYRRNYNEAELRQLIEHIQIMDKAAVERLIHFIKISTHGLTIYGYEDKIVETGQKLELLPNNIFRQGMDGEEYSFIWPFTEEKTYEMKFVAGRLL